MLAIPDFKEILLPLLNFAGDGKKHSVRETEKYLSKHFNLTQEERTQLKSTGAETLFYNRVRWARLYLKRSGLVTDPEKSYFKITPRGSTILTKNLSKIDLKLLMKFPEFVEWQKKKHS